MRTVVLRRARPLPQPCSLSLRIPISIKRQLSTRLLTAQCVTVSLSDPSASSKDQVAEAITNALTATDGELTWHHVLQTPDCAILLATPGLASWLQDQSFVSKLLLPFYALPRYTSHMDLLNNREPGTEYGVAGQKSEQEFDVLSAVVDGIPRGITHSHLDPLPAREGLTLLHGSRNLLLPKLRDTDKDGPEDDPAVSDASAASVNNSPGSLAFKLRTPRVHFVTVPLANTIFNNGSPYTLFVSRWQGLAGPSTTKEGPKLEKIVTKTSQMVNLLTQPTRLGYGKHPSPWHHRYPLVPVTQARRIVSGLGNILRQIEIDGEPAPASKELEDIIPKLLAARSAALSADSSSPAPSPPGPMGVWAVVYPEGFEGRGIPAPLPLELAGTEEEKSKKRLRSPQPFLTLLQDGTRIYRIRK